MSGVIEEILRAHEKGDWIEECSLIANAYRSTEHSYSKEDLSKALSQDISTIKKKIALGSLPKDILRTIRRRKITLRAASGLLALRIRNGSRIDYSPVRKALEMWKGRTFTLDDVEELAAQQRLGAEKRDIERELSELLHRMKERDIEPEDIPTLRAIREEALKDKHSPTFVQSLNTLKRRSGDFLNLTLLLMEAYPYVDARYKDLFNEEIAYALRIIQGVYDRMNNIYPGTTVIGNNHKENDNNA